MLISNCDMACCSGWHLFRKRSEEHLDNHCHIWHCKSQEFKGHHWHLLPVPIPEFPTSLVYLREHVPLYGTDNAVPQIELKPQLPVDPRDDHYRDRLPFLLCLWHDMLCLLLPMLLHSWSRRKQQSSDGPNGCTCPLCKRHFKLEAQKLQKRRREGKEHGWLRHLHVCF